MKRKSIIVTTAIIILFLFFCWLYLNNKKCNNLINHVNNLNTINSFSNSQMIEKNVSINTPQTKYNEIENVLSEFSTNLSGDENRLENVRLSCEKINGTILCNGDTFSFNDIIGEPTAEKGYKEADVIVNTTVSKALGGGNCQVSTTLYNAVLNIDGITIIERNPHKKKVSYVEEGKDASVSYGILDLKFENNTGSKIKIYMDSKDEKVNAKIVRLNNSN